MPIVKKKVFSKKTGEVKVYEYDSTEYFKQYYLDHKAYKSAVIQCELCGSNSQRQFLARHQRTALCAKLTKKRNKNLVDKHNDTLSSNKVVADEVVQVTNEVDAANSLTPYYCGC